MNYVHNTNLSFLVLSFLSLNYVQDQAKTLRAPTAMVIDLPLWEEHGLGKGLPQPQGQNEEQEREAEPTTSS